MSLTHPQSFFAAVRTYRLLGATLEQSEVDGLNVLLQACDLWPISWAAYALATAWHETAHTMQPIKEHGSDAYFTRMYDPTGLRPAVAAQLGNTMPGDGPLYCGRGYAQLTGHKNYQRADEALGLLLVNSPDLAMVPDVAAKILRRGMEEGWFSGVTLADCLPDAEATHEQFADARRIVNGQDDAAHIADAALAFQRALHAGAWLTPFAPAPQRA